MTTWGLGEYHLMAARLEPLAEVAVDLAGDVAGRQVLDVACGTGNAALVAAARGARVTGVDFEPALLSRAAERARSASLFVEWVLGDLEDLPLASGSVDVALSVLGVMYARDRGVAATELARVLAPAGRVVLVSWSPGGLLPAFGAVVAPFLAPVAPGPSPTEWGDEGRVTDILASGGLVVETVRSGSLRIDVADVAEATDLLLRSAGHVVAERDRLVAEGRWDEVLGVIGDLVELAGESVGGGLSLEAPYLAVVARRS